jgi:uncharacterized protein
MNDAGGSMLGALLAAYPWYDHAEGMKFVEMHQDAHRTVGHWLFLPGMRSTFHRVRNCEEIWAIHHGSLLLHVLEPNGVHRVVRLGSNVGAGERPVASVRPDCWQAAELAGGAAFAFGTNVCAPGFRTSEFEIGPRAVLRATYPQHTEVIERLTSP